MKPRIYTYKITFEETQYFYYGIHKEKRFGEHYLGTPVTHAWMWNFYTPKKQILEFFESWEEAKEVEDRLIRPFLNDRLCLNEAVGFYKSVESCARGGKAAAELQKKNKTGFYGPKTERQMETSRKEGTKWGYKYGPENGRKVGRDNVKLSRGLFGLTEEERAINAGKGGKVGGKNTGSQRWKDPDHPELGEKPAGVLAGMQKRRGYPYSKENRIRVK